LTPEETRFFRASGVSFAYFIFFVSFFLMSIFSAYVVRQKPILVIAVIEVFDLLLHGVFSIVYNRSG